MDMRYKKKLVAAVACSAFLLGGCATTRGGPESDFDSVALVKLARSYSVDTVDTKIDSLDSDQAGQQRYRNKVIRAYLTAIDSQFFQFRSNLGLEGRGGALGFDLLALGLATAGALSMGAAPELAAAAGVATGSRAAIDKNLLFEKTLPAIFASMDAARLRQRTLIVERMKGEYGDYPMEAAWNDLQNYQVAGTMDDAVGQVTDKAASDRETARAAYNRSLGLACDASSELVPLRTQLGELIFAASTKAESTNSNDRSKGREDLQRIALAFSVDEPGRSLGSVDELDKFRDDILNKIEIFSCSSADLRQTLQILSQ